MYRACANDLIDATVTDVIAHVAMSIAVMASCASIVRCTRHPYCKRGGPTDDASEYAR